MLPPDDYLDQLVVGAEAFAVVIFGNDDPLSVRRVRHWIARGLLRTKKMGQLHTSTPRELRRQLATPAADQAA